MMNMLDSHSSIMSPGLLMNDSTLVKDDFDRYVIFFFYYYFKINIRQLIKIAYKLYHLF